MNHCPVCIAHSIAAGLPSVTVADATGLAVSVIAHCRMGSADLCEPHREEVVMMIARLRRAEAPRKAG